MSKAAGDIAAQWRRIRRWTLSASGATQPSRAALTTKPDWQLLTTHALSAHWTTSTFSIAVQSRPAGAEASVAKGFGAMQPPPGAHETLERAAGQGTRRAYSSQGSCGCRCTRRSSCRRRRLRRPSNAHIVSLGCRRARSAKKPTVSYELQLAWAASR